MRRLCKCQHPLWSYTRDDYKYCLKCGGDKMKIYNAILIGESINSRGRYGVTIESFETKEACENFIKRNPSFNMLESDE